jgi:hypothetical protein
MRKLLLLTTFFTLAPIVLIMGIILTLFATYQQNHSTRYASFSFLNQPSSVAYAALPTEVSTFKQEIQAVDGRVESVRQFLNRYDSPLEPYAQNFVDMADAYDLDYRLVPAIAMQETNLCKKAKEGSHNCWGFGVYGTKYHFFDSYPQAIEAVSKTLGVKYKAKGLITPEQIMTMYTPSSNGSWAFGVRHFMERM